MATDNDSAVALRAETPGLNFVGVVSGRLQSGTFVFDADFGTGFGLRSPPGSSVQFRLSAVVGGSQLLSDVIAAEIAWCSVGTKEEGDECTPCAPGTYQDQRNQTECLSCPPGRFQEKAGADECSLCGTGKSTGGLPASTACITCVDGFYSESGYSECVACGSDAVSVALNPLEGFSACECEEGFYNRYVYARVRVYYVCVRVCAYPTRAALSVGVVTS